MDYESALNGLSLIVAPVAAAPLPFLAAIIVVGVAEWCVLNWYYRGRLESLESRLAQRDEENERLKASATLIHSTAPAVTPTASPSSTQVDKRAERSSALIRIRNAVDGAKYSLDPQFRDHGALVLPELRSALLTAHKQFGLRLPKKLHDARTEVSVALEYFERVRPLLAAGHDREAQEEAESFLDSLHSEK